MTGIDLARMYEISYGAINRNLLDVSQEESLVRPQPGGNCLNWVLGHIGLYRGMMQKIIGRDPIFSGSASKPY